LKGFTFSASGPGLIVLSGRIIFESSAAPETGLRLLFARASVFAEKTGITKRTKQCLKNALLIIWVRDKKVVAIKTAGLSRFNDE
jgi:hypothetical protein